MRDEFNNNNIQERLNGEFKNRLVTTRGLNADEPALVRLLIIYHNLFRRHEGLKNRTPAQAVGITIEGPNQWATVIANAALPSV